MGIFRRRGPAKHEVEQWLDRVERTAAAERYDELSTEVEALTAACEAAFGRDSATTARAHNVKIAMLGGTGRLDDARAHFHAVLPPFAAQGWHSGSAVPGLHLALAMALQRQEYFAEAEVLFKTVLNDWLTIYPDPSTAFGIEVKIASGAVQSGRYAEGHARFTGLLRRLEFVREPADRRFVEAACRHNVAYALIGLGDYAGAEAQACAAEAAFAEMTGPSGEGVHAAASNRAWAQLELGRFAEAEAGCRGLLAELEATDNVNPLACSIRTTLGRALAAQGRMDEALTELRTAVDIGRRTQGTTCVRTVRAVVALADVLAQGGDVDEARGLLAQAVLESETVNVPRYPNPWLDTARARLAVLASA
ncbi:tetratricopeptide repeat protein [Yinghuangia seranimata]|uniref:tetratricopeptide repeat protein n=1 Tax=Yinghuangia seranimata TaxID=408067 RepID=UPI00248D0EEF|nr:tetratricopeptide repeat protein [Yinghuangia seranimata]MDI2130715.1 tetratricopeptide repeat protein [Yinghuangia seranimata]